MSRTPTKAAGNAFYEARIAAAKYNDRLSSRDGAAREVGISKSRLDKIECDIDVPYHDELRLMARAYNAPGLLYDYCKNLCPIGCEIVPSVDEKTLDRAGIQTLAVLERAKEAREILLRI